MATPVKVSSVVTNRVGVSATTTIRALCVLLCVRHCVTFRMLQKYGLYQYARHQNAIYIVSK